jgi:SAM-dependent methyltransferase
MQCFLAHPALRNLEMGTKDWFTAQKAMIKAKPLVKRCYDLWYQKLLEDADSAPSGGSIIELGSGSSYVKELRPEVITSDCSPGVADMVIDGRSLPFPDSSVRAILLTHVFHHIPDVGLFFEEASRVLVPGGVISMVDETHTPFAKFFFSKVHPEPYDDQAPSWSFVQSDSMLDSNQALSWIVFMRDREEFARRFPLLKLERREYLPWFSYLMSGGVNLRSCVPRFCAPVFPWLDRALRPLDGAFAIHWRLTIRKERPRQEVATLADEARYIHNSFFSEPLDQTVIDRYVAANRLCIPQLDDRRAEIIDRIVSTRLDLEAIELVFRLRQPDNLLTKKIQILFYLVEVRSAYYRRFINDDANFSLALRSLAGSALGAVWKFLKGRYLVWKYKLV